MQQPDSRGLALMESLRAASAKQQQPQQPQQPQQQQLALRQAMSQLVQKPAFLDMLAEELKAVGLL